MCGNIQGKRLRMRKEKKWLRLDMVPHRDLHIKISPWSSSVTVQLLCRIGFLREWICQSAERALCQDWSWHDKADEIFSGSCPLQKLYGGSGKALYLSQILNDYVRRLSALQTGIMRNFGLVISNAVVVRNFGGSLQNFQKNTRMFLYIL